MYYENIPNWGSFNETYSKAVQKFNDGAIFVEIGAWLGSSTVCMAENIMNSGKDIKFYTIDPFDGKGESYENYEVLKNDKVYETYLNNIEPVKEYINTLRGLSYEFVDMFDNKSIDFVFIDGDHSYEGILRDLREWFPKIKDEGLFAGHDYNNELKVAVDTFFADKIIPNFRPLQVVNQGCWYYENKKL